MMARKVRCAATPNLRLITAGEKSGRPLLAGVASAIGVHQGDAMFTAPDWKDAGAYRHLGRYMLRSIAWEFLRRQERYQQAWSSFASELRAHVATDDALAGYVEYLLLPSSERRDEDLDAGGAKWSAEERARFEEQLQWDFESTDDEIREWGLWHVLTHRHGAPVGVARIVHPQDEAGLQLEFLDGSAAESSPVVEVRGAGLVGVEEAAKAEGAAIFSQSKWLALLIDLSAPAEVIKTDVLGWIDRQRKFRIKRGFVTPVTNRAQKRSTYIEYLRILDGIAAGEDITRIGEVLAPDDNNDAPDRPRDKRFRTALKTAAGLRDGGYQQLLRLESRQPRKKK